MKISDLFASGKRKLFSFEFFPPKTDAGQQALERTIRELAELAPAFVSVTYGAGGSTRSKTIELVRWIEREAHLTAMAHLTCVGASQEEIGGVVDRLVESGIDNVMVLRGDPPAGQEQFERTAGGFGYASDLVGFIRKRFGPRLCLGGAGNPEGHVECRDLDQDIMHLKTKVDAGLDFVVTQLFFDNRVYFDFVKRARAAGITVPIVPGLMPIRNVGRHRTDDEAQRRINPGGAERGAAALSQRRRGRGRAGHRADDGAGGGAAARRRSRHPLLYAQSVARDARHLDRAQDRAPGVA